MAKITSIRAREILDSRGNPTIEARVVLDDGSEGIAGVPSGASVGTYEALELRDKDPERFNGKGVLAAVANVNGLIAPELRGLPADKQREIDKKLLDLDRTYDKSKLGANSILSVSMAVAIAAAHSRKLPLYVYFQNLAKSVGLTLTKLCIPTPTFNIINGGAHGGGNIEFQEFHVVPAVGKTFAQSLQMGSEIYHALQSLLVERGLVHSVGDEGGFAPNLASNADSLQLLVLAIKKTRYQIGTEVFLGLDLAANHFFRHKAYVIKDKPAPMSQADFVKYLVELDKEYPISYLEDALNEDDWTGWQRLTSLLGSKTMIVGDDLLVTNPKRLQQAISLHACNAILIKSNQIGTLSETLEVIKLAKRAGFKTIVSHRSGETNDTYNADLAVGVGADYVKFGAPARGERVGKYNRLLEIEDELRDSS